VNVRQWIASKWNPARYGDQQWQVAVQVSVANTCHATERLDDRQF
jgi:hypothetical protein